MQETQEMQVGSLGQEDALEETATHHSFPAWKIPWTWWAIVHAFAKIWHYCKTKCKHAVWLNRSAVHLKLTRLINWILSKLIFYCIKKSVNIIKRQTINWERIFARHVSFWHRISIKKAECQRIDAFELWSRRRLVSSLGCKEIQPVHPKANQSWIFIGSIDAEAETPILWLPDANNTHLKRPWCWEWLKAGGAGDDRGWDGWMASPTQWIWVWVNSGNCWWTGRPGMLQSMLLQRVGLDLATEQQEQNILSHSWCFLNTTFSWFFSHLSDHFSVFFVLFSPNI